jgi:hypothetical protein
MRKAPFRRIQVQFILTINRIRWKKSEGTMGCKWDASEMRKKIETMG